MNARAKLPFWRVVFLLEGSSPRRRPIPFPLNVQAVDAIEARELALKTASRFLPGFSLAAKNCFVTEARA